MGALNDRQVSILIIIERVTASISVIATVLLIFAYVFIKRLRTMSNTLIFAASFANLFANVAALIGGNALSNTDSGLCQFQGFLLEMFMQSDPLWSCAMAINVFLVFFFRYDAERLKKLYWVYGAVCYGIPMIPAMFFLFYKTKDNTKVYGNATLWCWIDNDHPSFRIWSYYLPIWIAIIVTFLIYFIVGTRIFKSRTKLRAAANDSKNDVYASNTHSSAKSQPFPTTARPAPFSGMRTTEIQVSTDTWDQEALKSPASVYARDDSNPSENPQLQDQYSITISGAQNPSKPEKKAFRLRMPRIKRPHSMDEIKWAYTKTALLFAISVLVTWVPASVNRIYGLINGHDSLRNPHNPSFALNVSSALVLPLQGFWNAVIFFMTSWHICRTVYNEYKQKRVRKNDAHTPNRTPNIEHLGGRRVGGPPRVANFRRPLSDTLVGLKHSEDSYEMSERGGSHRDDSDSSDLGTPRRVVEGQRGAFD